MTATNDLLVRTRDTFRRRVARAIDSTGWPGSHFLFHALHTREERRLMREWVNKFKTDFSTVTAQMESYRLADPVFADYFSAARINKVPGSILVVSDAFHYLSSMLEEEALKHVLTTYFITDELYVVLMEYFQQMGPRLVEWGFWKEPGEYVKKEDLPLLQQRLAQDLANLISQYEPFKGDYNEIQADFMSI